MSSKPTTPEPHDFDCGCKLRPQVVEGVKQLTLIACSKGKACEIVQMMTAEAIAQGKGVETRYE